MSKDLFDDGKTFFRYGRVSRTEPYNVVNCYLDVLASHIGLLGNMVQESQNDLFRIIQTLRKGMGEIAVLPENRGQFYRETPTEHLIGEADLKWIIVTSAEKEAEVEDQFVKHSWITGMKSGIVAQANICRAQARLADVHVTMVSQDFQRGIYIRAYVNHLSEYLFQFARAERSRGVDDEKA